MEIRNKCFKYITGIMLLFLCCDIQAQDIHFSQFYASPLTLNPAMTGSFDGKVRATLQYREQWRSFMEPYTTSGASIEHAWARKSDKIGAGLNFVNDKTGTSAGINTFKVHLSTAYNKIISMSNGTAVLLATGFQVGYSKKNAFGTFTYPDQWVNGNFNPTVGLETDPFLSPGYLDVNFGTIISYVFDPVYNSSVFLGASAFHLNQPSEIFIKETVDNKLATRSVLHGGSNLVFAQGVMTITPNFIMMFQNGAREINMGSSFEYNFAMVSSINARVSLGSWYRLDDAVIIGAGLAVKDFQFGFSYDINTSDLTLASDGKGAFELTMRYIFKSKFLSLEANPYITM